MFYHYYNIWVRYQDFKEKKRFKTQNVLTFYTKHVLLFIFCLAVPSFTITHVEPRCKYYTFYSFSCLTSFAYRKDLYFRKFCNMNTPNFYLNLILSDEKDNLQIKKIMPYSTRMQITNMETSWFGACTIDSATSTGYAFASFFIS